MSVQVPRTPEILSGQVSFECAHCGVSLTIPQEKAGVSGPCPLCGEWLASPGDSRPAPRDRGMMMELGREPEVRTFAARAGISVGTVRTEEESPRMKEQIDWRERRARRNKIKNWFERRQMAICITVFVLSLVLVGTLHSMGWKLPWQLSEDSAVMRFIDGFGEGGGGAVPTTISK